MQVDRAVHLALVDSRAIRYCSLLIHISDILEK